MPQVKSKMQSLLSRTSAFLTPSSSTSSIASLGPKGRAAGTFTKSPTAQTLFPPVAAAVDGPDCLLDCASCTVHYPAKFSINEDDRLYGEVKGWATHLIVATGKADWVRDVADEKGSLMEAVAKYGQQLDNGKCMLSASNMLTMDGHVHGGKGSEHGSPDTRVLVLPQWKLVEGVLPAHAKELMERVVASGPTNYSPLASAAPPPPPPPPETNGVGHKDLAMDMEGLAITNGTNGADAPAAASAISSIPPTLPPPPFSIRACPHRAVILLCSQKTRDARCGQSAPLLRKEFERHLRPLGLYRDAHDERPGGVAIIFISHVGGHKYSANCMIYRRQGVAAPKKEKEEEEEGGEQVGSGDGLVDGGAPLNPEAVQGIWLARVRPEDCEGIIKYTVLQGKVVKPNQQLRGGFDRERGLVSW